MSKVAVVLSGCGFMDGAEIQEAVLCFLALDECGLSYRCFAPDMDQARTVDHLTGEEAPETRNVLVESARITRGAVEPLDQLDEKEFDALLIPGGFGVAFNLSSWAMEQDKCQVDPILKEQTLAFHKSGKPIGATCIAPAIIAKIFEGQASLKLTLGSSDEYTPLLSLLGMETQLASVSEMVLDSENRIYTTPAYMEGDFKLGEMYAGIGKVVGQLAKDLAGKN